VQALRIAGARQRARQRIAAASARQSQLMPLAQQKQLAAPYTGLGQDAIAKYEALLGLRPKGKAVPGQGPARARVLSREGQSIQETLAPACAFVAPTPVVWRNW